MTYVQTLNQLLLKKGWKAPAITGAAALVILALLESVLFTLILGLIKLVLVFGGLALLIYAAYLAYPTVLAKLKAAR